MTEDNIEDHIGLTDPDGFAQNTDGETVTDKVVFADGGHGMEKEATLRSHQAGASSDAPAGSGIPSAEKQHAVNGDVLGGQPGTATGGGDIPTRQNLEP